MSAKQAAIMDIQEELSKKGKCFLAFHEELDPIMEAIVNRELRIRESQRAQDDS